MAAHEQIAQTFCNQYYTTFDTNRVAVGSFYAPTAVLTFEGVAVTGPEAIVAKLSTLTFQQVQHCVTTMDAQLTSAGLLVVVVGQLKADSDQVLGFTQTFHLAEVDGSLFIANDVFRLTLHHG
ncbi:nuclear transport factor 2-like [Sycon ciliatum]|uniref:nuclear transport factor 2-like n=1 Tax=Sycon ciliatum TaxID=27933 RepID=UPI0020AC3895|eukprot:scpid92954/ scgid28659/ Nuclear transport factor 2; Nuclear transport factor 2; Placental protein 15; Nuclear transport factor 2; Nuclear transport factor 2